MFLRPKHQVLQTIWPFRPHATDSIAKWIAIRKKKKLKLSNVKILSSTPKTQYKEIFRDAEISESIYSSLTDDLQKKMSKRAKVYFVVTDSTQDDPAKRFDTKET